MSKLVKASPFENDNKPQWHSNGEWPRSTVVTVSTNNMYYQDVQWDTVDNGIENHNH